MSSSIALLATALALQATADVQLLPAGEFTGRDGRPGNGLTWKLSDQAGRDLAAKLNARHATVHFNMDYEHQAMLTEKNGQPAPASGWASKFEWRRGRSRYRRWTRGGGSPPRHLLDSHPTRERPFFSQRKSP